MGKLAQADEMRIQILREQGWGAKATKSAYSAKQWKLGTLNEIYLEKIIWENLPQETIDRAVLAFRRRLQACIRAQGGHFEHQIYSRRIKGPFKGQQILKN